MSKRSDQLLINDILGSVKKIQMYTKGYDFVSFSNDPKTIDAVTRNLEVIGEAGNRISEECKRYNSEIEWRKMIGLRNRIVHDYFGIDLVIVWEIVESYIPVLKKEIRKVQKKLGSQE